VDVLKGVMLFEARKRGDMRMVRAELVESLE